MNSIQHQDSIQIEDANIYRLWQDCQNKIDVPSLNDYMPLGMWQDQALEMLEARSRDKQPGGRHLKRIFVVLTNLKQPTTEEKKLVRILSGTAPQQPGSNATEVEVTRDEQLYPPLPQGVLIPSDVTLGACPLKEEYINYSKELSPEGYEEFHPSCFWQMLSTVAGRRVAIDMRKKQYTPLAVMLAARSTLFAKTETVEVERVVLKAAGLDWLLGLTRTTPQKLLLDMSGPIPEDYAELNYDAQEQVKLQLAMSGQRGWMYNEFGKLIKSMMRSSGPMSDFVEILLQISDCLDFLPSGTVGRGNENIISPYLTIAGTLTPVSIKSVAGRNTELWADGFLSRIVWSCPPPAQFSDCPFKQGQLPVPSELSTPLRQWHERLGLPELDIVSILDEKGEVTGRYKKVWNRPLPETLYRLSDPAYDAWVKYRSALKKMIATELPTNDFDGSYGRLSTMALRVAALAASVMGASQIEYVHWALGQEQAEMWRSSLHQLYAQVTSDEAPSAEPTLDEKIIKYVQRLEITKAPTARDVARAMNMSIVKIEPILQSLVKNGVLEQEPGRQSPRYKLSAEEEE